MDDLRRRAVFWLVLTNVLWGLSFPAMKAANMIIERELGEEPGFAAAGFFIVLRFAAALLMLALLRPVLFRGLTPARWAMGAVTGLAFSGGFLLQVVGLNTIPASRSGFLTSLSVLFTPIFVTLATRRAPRAVFWAAALLALAGMAVLSGVRFAPDAFRDLGLGDALTAAGAAIFAIQILVVDHFGRRMPSEQLTPGMFASTFVCGLVAFFAGGGWTHGAAYADLASDGGYWSLVLGMSFFCSVLAFTTMNRWQPHVSPSHAAVIYALEPLCATLWAMWLPGVISGTLNLNYPSELFTVALAAGGALVIAGNVLASLPTRERPLPG